MQTRFTAEQLADPAIAESNRILRACVHCGFCTATCPTYRITGDELDSPRGRIYLIKEMLESGRAADTRTVRHLDRCLTCLGCMTTCPSGVNYMHLVDHARRHVERTYRRPGFERWLRVVLAWLMSEPRRFRAALAAAGLARPFTSLMPARLRRLVEFAPRERPVASPARGPGTNVAAESRGVAATGGIRRVAFLPGCVQPVLRPSIDAAAMRLCERAGLEVLDAAGVGCCGALAHHLGHERRSLAQARAAIDGWIALHERGGLDAIVVTSSGCGTMLKDYGFLFRDDPMYAGRAARVAALTRDVSEVLDTLALPPATRGAGLRVAYHAACSLAHGQHIVDAPRRLLRRAGFDVIEIPDGHLCCGSAGTYNLLQPELSDELLARKLANIASVAPAAIAAGNIGCLVQIARGAEVPVLHTVELLDWATGGPAPAGLARLERPVRPAPGG